MTKFRAGFFLLLFFILSILNSSKSQSPFNHLIHARLNATQHNDLDRPLIELIPSLAQVTRAAIDECHESINDNNSSYSALFKPNNTLREVLYEYYSYFDEYSATANEINNLIENLENIVNHVIECDPPTGRQRSNYRKPTFKVGLTSLSNKHKDYLASLCVRSYTNFENSTRKLKGKQFGNCKHKMHRKKSLPKKFDTRTKEATIATIRNQGRCGSCWAFATAGTFEGALAMAKKSVSVLSPQYLLDYDTKNNGCEGGFGHSAFKFALRHGLPTEKNYPYTGIPKRNNKKYKGKIDHRIKNFCFKYSKISYTERKKQIYKFGPSWFQFTTGRSFVNYKSGLYEEKDCYSEDAGFHSMTIIGWDDSHNALLIRNSYSERWGMTGTVYIKNDACNGNKAYGYMIA